MIQCFMLERTNQVKRWLRIYGHHDESGHYHQGKVELDVVDEADQGLADDPALFADRQWPTNCKCGADLTGPGFTRQIFALSLWRRVDTGEVMPIRDAPAGAMYYADWFHEFKHFCGPDGRSLHVRVPDGHGKTTSDHDWAIDARANNCDSPCAVCTTPYHSHKNMDHSYVDSVPEHRCWVRHGEPPNVTVDKNGLTCNAGAGSIATPQWHGFLRNGQLVE